MPTTRGKGINSQGSKGSRKVDIKTKTEQGKGQVMKLENVTVPRRMWGMWSMDEVAEELPESEILSGAWED